MSYQKINVHPIAGALGAEVEGIDLSGPLDQETLAEIQQAWLKYLVLFFRDQELSPDQFKKFISNFGALITYPFLTKIEGDEYVERLSLAEEPANAPPTTILHIDLSMVEVPTKGAALYAVDVGEAGGDTIWVSAYAAYEGLSEPMKEFIRNRRGLFPALHDAAIDRMIKGGPEASQTAKMFLGKPSEHPLVHTHPETGKKALFVDPLFTWSIKDLHQDESDALLSYLSQHIAKPEFHCRFHWRPGSLAVWDNRCTLHKRVDDAYDKRRVMHRLGIEGTQAPSL